MTTIKMYAGSEFEIAARVEKSIRANLVSYEPDNRRKFAESVIRFVARVFGVITFA